LESLATRKVDGDSREAEDVEDREGAQEYAAVGSEREVEREPARDEAEVQREDENRQRPLRQLRVEYLYRHIVTNIVTMNYIG